MKRICSLLLTAILFLAACKNKSAITEATALNTTGIEATAPYLTTDHKGNPVLAWAEKDGKDSLYRLKYAIYNQEKNEFGSPFTVATSRGCSSSAESMGKVAFKSDGTVVAIFAKKFPNEKSPYAGAICYSMSTDAGKNWSDAAYIHADTSHAYGRSFFDIARLKDGELAAIWLDGRYGKSIKGSALFFNQTGKGKGFGIDTCLDKGTCECCRTEILIDDAGNIHLAYRSISFPSVLSGKQVRDMVYKISADNGRTFSAAKPISNDNWEIEGCPHSGPSLAVVKNAVHAVWFTAGGSPGLYTTSAILPDGTFRNRNLVTASGRHPQLIALPDGKLMMVCEEAMTAEPEPAMKMDHSKHGMAMNHAPAGLTKVVASVFGDHNEIKTIEVTDGKYADNHAVLAVIDKKVLVAWVRERQSGAKIFYSFLKI